MHHVLYTTVLVKHQITQVTQRPCSPDLAPCDFWLFPKLKSPLKGKRFQAIDKIQETMMGQLMVIGRTVWGSNMPTLKGTKASLSYVQCFLYLRSSSINVSIFHSTWLDTFWTDLIYICKHRAYTYPSMWECMCMYICIYKYTYSLPKKVLNHWKYRCLSALLRYADLLTRAFIKLGFFEMSFRYLFPKKFYFLEL